MSQHNDSGCLAYFLFVCAVLGCCSSYVDGSAASRERARAEREHSDAEHLRSQLRILHRHYVDANDKAERLQRQLRHCVETSQ